MEAKMVKKSTRVTRRKPRTIGFDATDIYNRLNDLEGKIAHLTGIVNALKGLVNAQDVLAPHIASFSVKLMEASAVMEKFDGQRREFQGALDVLQILGVSRVVDR
jgi:hypothetical protein